MSRIYRPDGWVVLEITVSGKTPYYKVLGSWSGGYLDADSWRLSSGADGADTISDLPDGRVSWPQASGSVYEISLSRENRLNTLTRGVLETMLQQAKPGGDIACKVVAMASIR